MNQEFIGALKEIVKDKGISEDLLFETIEDALVAAYKMRLYCNEEYHKIYGIEKWKNK